MLTTHDSCWHGCVPHTTGLEIPGNLSLDNWLEVGHALGKSRAALQWMIGDWWIAGQRRYGERTEIVSSDDWRGPTPDTCKNYGAVARSFDERSRRRDVLSFSHHAEVAALDPEVADALLTWCVETESGKPRSLRDLRERRRQHQAGFEGAGIIPLPQRVTVSVEHKTIEFPIPSSFRNAKSEPLAAGGPVNPLQPRPLQPPVVKPAQQKDPFEREKACIDCREVIMRAIDTFTDQVGAPEEVVRIFVRAGAPHKDVQRLAWAAAWLGGIAAGLRVALAELEPGRKAS